MAYGRNFYNDQQVFLGAEGSSASELKGVQSFDGDWSLPYTPMVAAGYDFVGTALDGELVGNVSVERYIIKSDDPVTGLLDTSVSGYLIYGKNQSFDKTFNFTKGYVDSYSVSCSIGDVISNNFNLTAYGGIGQINSETSGYSPIVPETALASKMTLTTPFDSTEAVQSIDFELSTPKTPIYTIGSSGKPSKFVTEPPIEATLDFSLIVNEYEISDIFDYICTPGINTLTLGINSCSESLMTINLTSGQLESSSIAAGIGDNMNINLSYKAYYSSVSSAVSDIF